VWSRSANVKTSRSAKVCGSKTDSFNKVATTGIKVKVVKPVEIDVKVFWFILTIVVIKLWKSKLTVSLFIIFVVTKISIDFKDNSDLNDYVITNIQINHDWNLGTNIEPHIHWFQNSNNTPNWLMQYRWQKQGKDKTSGWISQKYT